MANELLFSGSDDFLCGVCIGEKNVLSVDAQGEEELEAADEGEQVEKVNAFSTPISPHSASIVTTVLRTSRTSPGARTATKVVDGNLDTNDV